MKELWTRAVSKRKQKAKVCDDLEESPKPLARDGVGPLVLRDDCEGSGSGADLVFVHGLRGSRLHTWSTDKICWPRDLLKDDVKNARVITWGYDSSVVKVFQFASEESIFGHAETLLADLARCRAGITRPIVFICHSLGGLVVKEALIKSATYSSYGRHPGLGEIYASTNGVIFLGTPHRGSAKEPLAQVVANVARFSFRQPNTQLLQTLAPDSHILENQRDQFTTISANLSTVCIREELPTAIGLIVPEASASYDGFNVRRDAIHANHMDMARYDSRGDQGYERTLSHIIELCSIQQSRTEKEMEKNEERKEEILQALSFLTMDDREQDIHDALDENCSWILGRQPTTQSAHAESSQFLEWVKSDETVFWISGKAGCGKSTLMKFIYHNQETAASLSQWAAGKDLVSAAYFLSDGGDKLQKSREGLLRSLLYQLLKANRHLIPAVFKSLFVSASPIPISFTTWSKLSTAFKSTLDQLGDTKVCIFIDGLDEYRMIDRMEEYAEKDLHLQYDGPSEDDGWGYSVRLQDGHREIAMFLRGLSARPNVKVCISSRELVIFEQLFRKFSRVRVHQHTAGAIQQYCERRLEEEAPDLANRSEFVTSITEKSLGVFLWVRLVVDMLVRGKADGNSREELWKTLRSLPPRLGGRDGLYVRMLQTINREYLPESKRLFHLVLEWEAYGYGPRHLDIISLFLAEEDFVRLGRKQEVLAKDDAFLPRSWEDFQPRWMELQSRLKSRCAGLIEGTKEVRFMHQTANEFMSRPNVWETFFHEPRDVLNGPSASLAFLSAIIRRLKCCQEATLKAPVPCHGSAPSVRDSNMSAKDLDMLAKDSDVSAEDSDTPAEGWVDTFGDILQVSGPCCPLLETALDWASNLESSDEHINRYIDLLDELDVTAEHLTRSWKEQFPQFADRSWLELFTKPWSGHLELCTQPRTFLEYSIPRRLTRYAESKIRGSNIPRPQLQSLLIQASRPMQTSWRGPSSIIMVRVNLTIIKLLFEAGADPNYQEQGPSESAVPEEGLTTWVKLLQTWVRPQAEQFEDDFPSAVKLFLQYNADRTVRWYTWREGMSKQVVTPESAIKHILSSGGQDKALREIMELLGETDQDLTAGQATAAGILAEHNKAE